MKPLALSTALLLLLCVLAPTAARANCSSHPADVAPGLLGSGMPTPTWTVIGNDVVDVQDVLVLLNSVVGRYNPAWTLPLEPGCGLLPGNVAPGDQDDGFFPPRWTPNPDGQLDVGDVLVALRFAVQLVELDPAALEPVLADGGSADRVVVGSVIDSVTSLGLPAVLVTALQAEEPVRQTMTDDSGQFLLQGLPPGTLTLMVDGSGSTAPGKFSSLMVEVEVEGTATTSLSSITLADGDDPSGASGKFTGDEEGTVMEEIDLSSDDGDIGVATGPGGKITVDGEPADEEFDLSVVPLSGDELPDEVTDANTGDGMNTTGTVAVGPASGKFSAGGGGFTQGFSGGGSVFGPSGSPVLNGAVEAGFDLILPNLSNLPLGTMVEIWHWDGSAWVNWSDYTGNSGEVVDVGGGRTAVRANGVCTDGGLYVAAIPIDFSCTSSAFGFVTDDAGLPLANVFVGTDLGVFAVTDEFGFFELPDLPAYTGLDFECEPRGFNVVVRAGVELGRLSTVIPVEAFEVFIGSSFDLGTIELAVPNEGCLSGLVLVNGVPQSGPVTITGPESANLTADAQGRFALTGLTPGSYRAAFQFPGEAVARLFDFEILPRECTTVRLARNQGAGTSRLTVQVFYDHDDDLLTPNGPLPGTRVRIVGSDPVSAAGLEAVTGSTGRVTFDGVSPPYDIVGIFEQSLAPPGSPGRGSLEGGFPFMRIGAGLETPAPLGVASLLLGRPVLQEFNEPYPTGRVTGALANFPSPAPGETSFAAPLRRGNRWDEPQGGYVDWAVGDYSANGYLEPFDLVFGVRDNTAWPFPVRELSFFGPLQVPPPQEPGGQAELMADFDYAAGDRLVFNQSLALTHTGFVTSQNFNDWAVSGTRMSDQRSFWTLSGVGGSLDGFPASLQVPAPASTDLSLSVELASDTDVIGDDAQSCFVPLPAVLPVSLNVSYVSPPEIQTPANNFANLNDIVNGPISYTGGSGDSTRGFDAIIFESVLADAGEGDLGLTSFRRYLPAAVNGEGALGGTRQPFVFVGEWLGMWVQSFRGDGLPSSFESLFGPGMEAAFQGLPHQPTPTCTSATSKELTILP